ncbi:acetyl-CoA carboxylase biotin carboxyl carrier protein [Thermoactinomyces mirandus]|uniref:Biotin carboxyl carrier protein of acetyl-CoA carboxylase n=1 Tax=Thermoactinomyces mirandus TaxID=2756294 RepID=A0A7W2AQV1_9BACL|nr:acetyl-CoA carboxylase biotin carboxyl carrier protein [Thermoactinomyces mirandus]MBA4600906.1 acetyl-CoA carboxylase biotin carboxyl carrier protein [Thermoactinomyces mirandus]
MKFRPYEIRELVRLIDESNIEEFEIEYEGNKLVIKKSGARTNAAPAVQAAVAQPAVEPAPVQSASAPKAPVQEAVTLPETGAKQEPAPGVQDEQTEDDSNLHKIVSPMVGTFYRAPAPDADPYVKEGDTVQSSTIVCIVEAMKLMNEIEAEVNGTIAKVLVENGQLVEYGQPLFLVKTT